MTEIMEAYKAARKNKRNTRSQLNFEIDLERNLFLLAKELDTRTYKVGPSSCFIVKKPVQREIFAAEFRDRVVHHLLFNRIAPVFERKFIHDSYSCRKGKGTLFAVRRLQHHTKSATENYKKEAWILKLDIEGYFMNIPREKLFYQCTKALETEDELTKYLLKEVIFNNPTLGCIIKGSVGDWYGLPRTKSLFHTPKDSGLPIGNLTSQLFSNVFLNPFDNFVKRELGVQHYGRYVDDFYLVHQSKNFLKELVPQIDEYLKENLGLRLHPKKRYLQAVSQGVEFVGVKFKNSTMLPGKRLRHNATAAFNEMNDAVKMKPYMCQNVPFLKKFITSANSYLGVMAHINSFELREKLVRKIDERIKEKLIVKPAYKSLKLIKTNNC
ncbi:MAG: RNA-directed DNA polymerase [Mucinivorans sp.]